MLKHNLILLLQMIKEENKKNRKMFIVADLVSLNSLRHIVKAKVIFDAELNDISLKGTNRPRTFIWTKVLSK